MNRVSEPTDAPLTRLSELARSCFVGDLEDGASAVVEHASARRGGYLCLCNVHVLTAALHDTRLRLALSRADIRFPDGAPVAWLMRKVGFPNARRIGGPDLMPRTFDRGRAVGLRHFLIGSTQRNLERLRHELDRTYPGAVVGVHAPPYAEELAVEEGVVELVRAAEPHIAWVALGAPKQELWCADATGLLPGVTLVGVGAAFDFLAGTKRRAPMWMHRAGLEWLHRLGSEPRRLTSRYVRSNSEFIARTAFELVSDRTRLPRR